MSELPDDEELRRFASSEYRLPFDARAMAAELLALRARVAQLEAALVEELKHSRKFEQLHLALVRKHSPAAEMDAPRHP